MAKVKNKSGIGNLQGTNGVPKALALAERGTRTVQDFIDRMDALQADCAARRLSVNEVNAIGGVAGKQLRMLDLAYKYGQVERGKGFFKRLGA